jgi:hypothetical protein
MRFRLLTDEELADVKPEFYRFLAANGAGEQDWNEFQKTDPAKATRILEMFSDLVFDRVLQKAVYLERRSAHRLEAIHAEAGKMTLLGLVIEGKTHLDFTKNDDPQVLFTQMQLSGARPRLMQAEKVYPKNREESLFRQLEQGFRISREGELYQLLGALVKTS